ncbi:uncharacterized protein CANTADRAFT_244282 [Suhomyces tanzawaensis NRRL Y-17324]|uniref:Uncharacterized protein n=1 Tax=Suhomyces tanzawaensis NRRL Y-17324 TaxID=984487 RepID=A0A1E4SHR9_9ASCO|nr:uncharacterized protein CANTADRAFT_244282 [Suhomyces tanzawaensis NRRL Y-17324]ODV79051.1 hypothetical protein CANTADRAFT_244282 [Suhomyces tanzawaensis NRRL Y-17324]
MEHINLEVWGIYHVIVYGHFVVVSLYKKFADHKPRKSRVERWSSSHVIIHRIFFPSDLFVSHFKEMKRQFSSLIMEDLHGSYNITFTETDALYGSSVKLNHTRPNTPNYLTPLTKSNSLPGIAVSVIQDLKLEFFNAFTYTSSLSGLEVCIAPSLEFSRAQNDTQLLDPFTFIFFLGSDGKEYIDLIRNKMSFASILIVTSNCELKSFRCGPPFMITDNIQCHRISSALNVLDPLGGGCYPLNYLMIADLKMKIRFKVPILTRVHTSSHRIRGKSFMLEGGSTYARFGLQIGQLDSFIEDFMICLMNGAR